MSHFSDAADRELFAELREVGLLSPDVVQAIQAARAPREGETLTEFLLAGAGAISAPDWLSWLIRRHGCHRFGPVRLALDGFEALPVERICAEPNPPYRRAPGGRLLCAVVRPDKRQSTAETLKPFRLEWAAATLGEVVGLKKAWADARLRGPATAEEWLSWFKAPDLKSGVGGSSPGVRIPPPPP
jgi:hypothetical protein